MLPTIRRVIELDDGAESEQWEEWESRSDAWDVQSEQLETQSEVWDIPTDDCDMGEWEVLYGGKFDQEARPYSAAVLNDGR
jgi:hypothetical protein